MKHRTKKIIVLAVVSLMVLMLLPFMGKKETRAANGPRIAICTTYGDPYTAYVSSIKYELERRGCYVEAISSWAYAADWDALVVPGGADVDPSFYGENNYACYWTNWTFDNETLAIIDKFVEAQKPILGLCRGLQILNVYFGGTLYQDIYGHSGGVYLNASTTEGSIMSKLLGSSATVYCSHHQSIKGLGNDLKVTMQSGSSVEAIEHTHLPIIAVQWHPELMNSNAPNAIFDYFVNDMVVNQIRVAESSDPEDGKWYTINSYTGEKVALTGFANNNNGRWRVENGIVDFNYEGLVYEQGEWRYYSGGKWTKKKTIAENESESWLVENGVINFSFTGFFDWEGERYRIEKGCVSKSYTNVEYDQNQWRYYADGKWQKDAETVAYNRNGWWYVKDGLVDFSFTGFADNSSGRWRIEKGKVNFNYNDVAHDQEEWRYYSGGCWQKNATIVAHNSSGWWYINSGTVDFGYNGLGENANGTWVCVNGKVDFGYKGLYEAGEDIWYIEGGCVKYGKTDVLYTSFGDISGWWNVASGKLVTGPTLSYNSNGWWFIDESGKVDFGYNGLGENANGTWVCVNGKVDFGYKGLYEAGEDIWYIEGGCIKYGKTDVLYADLGDISGWWNIVSGKLQAGPTVAGNSSGWWYINESGKVDFSFDGEFEGKTIVSGEVVS